MKAHFILYVNDQSRSSAFYRSVLDQEPALDVDGMTEFIINDGAVLGLMPETGIPRAEIYLLVEDPGSYYDRAVAEGAISLSPLSLRNWGDQVAYCEDPDGHILAFAKREIR
jgi:uncharacterized protein